MDGALRQQGQRAVERLDAVLAAGSPVEHEAVRQAVTALVAFRDLALDRQREGRVGRELPDQANALLSLAYGALFPLAGYHQHRLEQTRDGMRALLDEGDA